MQDARTYRLVAQRALTDRLVVCPCYDSIRQTRPTLTPMPTITPYAEPLKLTQEQRAAKTYETKVSRMKASGDFQLAELRKELAKAGDKLVSLCSQSELNFKAILDQRDTIALLSRRLEQFTDTLK